MNKFLLTSILALAGSSAHAVIIATNDFTGFAGSTTTTANHDWTNPISNDTGVTLGPLFTSTVNFRNIAGGGGQESLNPDINIGNGGTFTISFSLTTAANAVDLSAFAFRFYATNGNGGDQASNQNRTASFALNILDSGANSIFTSSTVNILDAGAGNSGNPYATGTLDLTGAPDLAANSTYTLALTVIGGASGFYASLDNFQLEGVTAVPEPSVALLGGLGVLALLRRRRA